MDIWLTSSTLTAQYLEEQREKDNRIAPKKRKSKTMHYAVREKNQRAEPAPLTITDRDMLILGIILSDGPQSINDLRKKTDFSKDKVRVTLERLVKMNKIYRYGTAGHGLGHGDGYKWQIMEKEYE